MHTQSLQKVKTLAVAALASLALLGAPSKASADVVDLFGVSPDSISAGEQSVLNLTLTLSLDPVVVLPGSLLTWIAANFTSATVTFFSGDGQEQTLSAGGGPGTTVLEFSPEFTYATPGTYFPSYFASYAYFELGTSCTSPDPCVPISQTVRNGLTGSGSLTVTDAAPVPLPAALPLFAGGLGVMAWLGRRKKRKAAAEA